MLENTDEFDELIGREVIYINKQGKEIDAKITAIPEKAKLGTFRMPIVSLEYTDDQDKFIQRGRVIPEGHVNAKRMVWRLK